MKNLILLILILMTLSSARSLAQNSFDFELYADQKHFSPEQAMQTRKLMLSTSEGPLLLQVFSFGNAEIQKVRISFDLQYLQERARSFRSSEGRELSISAEDLRSELILALLAALQNFLIAREASSIPPLAIRLIEEKNEKYYGAVQGGPGKIGKIDVFTLTYSRSLDQNARNHLRIEYRFNPFLQKQGLMLVFNHRF